MAKEQRVSKSHLCFSPCRPGWSPWSAAPPPDLCSCPGAFGTMITDHSPHSFPSPLPFHGHPFVCLFDVLLGCGPTESQCFVGVELAGNDQNRMDEEEEEEEGKGGHGRRKRRSMAEDKELINGNWSEEERMIDQLEMIGKQWPNEDGVRGKFLSKGKRCSNLGRIVCCTLKRHPMSGQYHSIFPWDFALSDRMITQTKKSPVDPISAIIQSFWGFYWSGKTEWNSVKTEETTRGDEKGHFGPLGNKTPKYIHLLDSGLDRVGWLFGWHWPSLTRLLTFGPINSSFSRPMSFTIPYSIQIMWLVNGNGQ